MYILHKTTATISKASIKGCTLQSTLAGGVEHVLLLIMPPTASLRGFRSGPDGGQMNHSQKSVRFCFIHFYV